MASSMNSSSINTTNLTVSANLNTIVFDTIDIDGSEDFYRLTDHGVGKIVLTCLDYNASGYPQIRTPYSSGRYFVFASASGGYYVNCKENKWWKTFVFMGLYDENTTLFNVSSSTTYIIHIKFED